MLLVEFPQNLIGLIAFFYFTKLKNQPYYNYQDSFVVHVKGRWGGISLSRFIFLDDNLFISNMVKHEYGHTIQSKILTILYIPIIGIPSLIWNKLFENYRRKNKVSYFSFFTEAWANKLGDFKE